jgi:hypothetical protein
VTGEPLSAWHNLLGDFKRLATKVVKSASVNLNSVPLRDEVKSVARRYMQEARPSLARPGFEEELKFFDEHFTKLYELAEGRNAAASYKRRINSVRKALPKVTSRLEMEVATGSDGPTQSAVEIQIAETLSGLVATAGLSYQQAIHDLADISRVSFRGPATELREVLREVLDHLAPDADVMKSDGFKLEKDRTKPTMKQKVRFILRARDQGATATELPEKAVESVEGLVGGLARSVYNFGSVVTHVAAERQAVVQLKRYVEVVLSHLLEL